MKDQIGIYYYPNPGNRKIRMYVKEDGGTICFRLWNQDDPKLFEEHGWVPHDAIIAAAKMYDGKTLDPKRTYDIDVARALLKKQGPGR